jgi:hypothetical protein
MDDLIQQMTVANVGRQNIDGAYKVTADLHPELMGVKMNELHYDSFSENAWAVFTGGGLEIWILPKVGI